MEGGGEGTLRGKGGLTVGGGMVAIFRGLQDAGLAVTLINEMGNLRGSMYAPRASIPPTPQYPLTHTEGTNTRLPITTNIGAQVCQDRFTSSYQLAHCNQRPSTPPVRLSKSPLRKPDVHRNQGSFERNGSEETSRSFCAAGVKSPYRASFCFPERGTPTNDVKASEAFADSLRKYPLIESPSADLISKLISYTQKKNEVNAIKSPRFLPKYRPEREKRRYKDKDIQTYTRTRPKIEELKSKSCKRMRIHSPAKDGREKRYKDSQLNETYDYLQSTSPLFSKTAEVRYLSDMSKCIRETIRQIVDDSRSEVCTQMQNRYLEHRKHCQSRSAHKQNGESSNAEMSQRVAVPLKPTDACASKCPHKAPPCYCRKRHSLTKQNSKEEFSRKVTEKVANWLLEIPTYDKMSAEDKQRRIDMVEDLANKLTDLKDAHDIEQKARKQVEDCLDKLPMWLPGNKSERDNLKSLLADNVMIKLTRVFEGTDKIDDEITKWINKIKFKSRDSFGEIIDKDKIADTFADRIKALTTNRPENDDDYHDTLNNEVQDILYDLPIEISGNKFKEIEKLASKLVNNIKSIPASEIKQNEVMDKFEKEILKWIDTIKFKRKDIQGHLVDKKEIRSHITQRLKSLALDRPLDEKDYHEDLKTEIVDILDEMPIEFKGIKDTFVDDLATKLVKSLKDIPAKEIKPHADEFDRMISQLMNDVKLRKRDTQGKIVDKVKAEELFRERLKAIAVNRPKDDYEYYEALINEALDILDDLPIEVEGNKPNFLEKIATKFAKALSNIPRREIKPRKVKLDQKNLQRMRKVKSKEIDSQYEVVNEDIPRILSIETDSNEDKAIEGPANKLAHTRNTIPTSDIMHNIAKSKTMKKESRDTEPYTEDIWGWLEAIPELSSSSQLDKNELVESLKRKLMDFKSKNTEDIKGFEDIIMKWLSEELRKKGHKLDYRTKEKLANQLSSNIFNTFQQQKNIPEETIKDCSKEIQDWLHDIPTFSGNREEKNRIIESLSKKLSDLRSEGELDENEIRDEITEWFSTESTKKGIKMDAKTKDNLVTQLAEKIFKFQTPQRSGNEIQEEIVTAVWNRLKDLPGIIHSEENKAKIGELAKRIRYIELGDNYSYNIRQEVDSWLRDFMEYSGVDPKHTDKLTKDLTSIMKSILKPNATYNELKQAINDEVSSIIDSSYLKFSPQAKKNVGRRVSASLAKNIMNVGDDKQDQEEIRSNIVRIIGQETDYSGEEAKELAESFIGSTKRISAIERRSSLKSESPEKVRALISKKVGNVICTLNIKNLKEIEDNLTHLLQGQVLSGKSLDFTTHKIMEVLQSANISEEDARDLTMRLTTQVQDFSSTRRDSVLALPTDLALNEKEKFQTSAVKEITDLMDELKGDDMNNQTKRKMKIEAQKLAERLYDTISDPNQSINSKEDTINYEIFRYLEKFNVPVEEHGYDLANRLKTVAATSTPKESLQDYSFCPRRRGFSTGSGYIPDDSKNKREQHVASDLQPTIEEWILGLPVSIDDEALIINIARNLASDIADRQKYLQSHPEVRVTDEEEFEFLKYQVFRAMGKTVEATDLTTIMSHAPALLAVIKDLLTPVLSEPPVGAYENEVVNKLPDEISMWVAEISSELKVEDLDYDKRQEKVKELAERLQKISETKENISEKINSEIIDWLKPLLKENKSMNVQNMADNLKNRLKLKGNIQDLTEELPSVSGDPFQQDTSQFIEENLSSGIMDWLKCSPFYQRRNPREKQIQENIMQDLARDVKKVIQRAKSDTDLDMEILKEVKKYIETIPMEPELKSDKAFIDKTSAQLVDYLKNMQMFENVSGRQSFRPLELLVSTVNDWIKSLPTNNKSLDTSENDELKMTLITRLSEALKDPNQQDDQSIKDNIQQFLQKLPVDIKYANDPRFIKQKVDQLFKNILVTPFLTLRRRPTINRDIVEKNIPLALGKPPEQVSDKEKDFTIEISNELEDTNKTAVDYNKNTLRGRTKVKSDSIVSQNLHDQAETLVTTIKDKAFDLTPKTIPYKNAADVLYDNITTWCEDLPLHASSTLEQKERANILKHNLASKLINKIGELNMNPAILNDDALYEHLIHEEINDLLSEVPQSPEMQANIESIKENLMTKVKEIKEKTKDEFAGQTYKQQLRETISKTLLFDVDLSVERPEPFELLVDNLADAYVNLHFITDSAEQKAEYKKKIADEITKYCNDYLKRHPEAPLDATKLNQNLLNALKKVPTPKEEIMRSEAEQVRIKDEINDWMKELPLMSDLSTESLQKNKMATVLAKKLLVIEKEKKVNPNIDYKAKAQKEIAKLFKKLPIEPGQEVKIDDMIKNLINKIQSSEHSRRISASTNRKSIALDSEPGESSTQSTDEDLHCTCSRKTKLRPVCNQNICNYKPTIPASTLSTEDQAHLEKIRLRNQPCQIRKIVCTCKDASVSPPPIDAASQTEITPAVPSICTRIPVSPRLSPCMTVPSVPAPPCSSSEQEVSPQIIVKEYLWDSGTSKLIGPVYRLPCIEVDTSNPSVPLPQKSVSIQPSPCSFPERSSCSAPRQTPPRPCINLNRPPCSDEVATPGPLRPDTNLGTSPYPSPHQISKTPSNSERVPCLSLSRPCRTGLGSSQCPSPYQIIPNSQLSCVEKTPLRPCMSRGTSPCPSPMPIPRSDTKRRQSSTRPCNLGRSPCSSPHQMLVPKPCITLPRAVISSQPSPCTNQSPNITPCQEIPYCTTPRRPILRDPNMPLRQPNFQHNSRACSPIDRENEGTSRVLRPRVINIGDQESLNPCRRRNDDERISEYKDSYRQKIYRQPRRDDTQINGDDRMRDEDSLNPCRRRNEDEKNSEYKDGYRPNSYRERRKDTQTNREDRMRCCKCNNRIRKVCQRHRSPHCPSTENVRHCSKCCGMPCPHPMRLFFR